MKIQLLRDIRSIHDIEYIIDKHLKEDCRKLGKNETDCEERGFYGTKKECPPCQVYRRIVSAYYRHW